MQLKSNAPSYYPCDEYTILGVGAVKVCLCLIETQIACLQISSLTGGCKVNKEYTFSEYFQIITVRTNVKIEELLFVVGQST